MKSNPIYDFYIRERSKGFSRQPGPTFGISLLVGDADDVTGDNPTMSGGKLNDDEDEIRRKAPFTPDIRPSEIKFIFYFF